MANVALILFIIVSIIFLFGIMVLTAMSSAAARKSSKICKKDCGKYSMWAALLTGLTTLLIFVSLVIYIYVSRDHITKYFGGAKGAGGTKFPAGLDLSDLPDVMA